MTTFDTVLELLAMWVQLVLILLVAGLVTQCAFSGSGNRHADYMGDHKIQHIRPGDEEMKTPLIHKLVSTLRRWHRRRLAIRELMALDDRMLDDIGVRRDDIHRAVDGLLRSAPRPATRATVSRERTATAQGVAQVTASDDESKLAA